MLFELVHLVLLVGSNTDCCFAVALDDQDSHSDATNGDGDSFVKARSAIFLRADVNEDGQLSHALLEREASTHAETSEWDIIFRETFEFQVVFGSPSALFSDRLVLVPPELRENLEQRCVSRDQFILLSRHVLNRVVEDNSSFDAKVRAHALLAQHKWTAAETALKDLTLGSPGYLQSNEVQSLASNLKKYGRYREARFLWEVARSARPLAKKAALETSEKQYLEFIASEFSHQLPRPRAKLPQELPASYDSSPYLRALRNSATAGCPEIAHATFEAVQTAIKSGAPTKLPSSTLVPGVESWSAAFIAEAESVAVFHVAPKGEFYSVDYSEGKDGKQTQWGVMPAQQPMKFADMIAAAALEDARFYFELADPHELGLSNLSALVPDAPAISAGLHLQGLNIWAALGGSTVSGIHWDSHESLLVQVHGSKELLLWPPADETHLYYSEIPMVQLSFTCCPPAFKRQKQKQTVRNVGAADFRELKRYPNLLETSPTYVRLLPGDALVLPAYWHHLVLSRPGSVTACELCSSLVNLAVNFWFLPHRPLPALRGLQDSSVVKGRASGQLTQEL